MLQLENVSVYYGGQMALGGLYYNFEPGHVYGLVGPNGCGKSTLMKVSAGLLKRYMGNAYWQGKKIDNSSRKSIAYLPTNLVYYRYMTPADMGEFYSDFFSDFNRDEYRKMIEFMGLASNMKIGSMSTGMIAKVRVAATLARNAELILLDEPLNGIDLLGQEQIRDMIRSIDKAGRIIIIASHMFDQLEAVCDFVIMMDSGRVIFHGDIGQLRAQYDMSVSDIYRRIYAQMYQAQTLGGMMRW